MKRALILSGGGNRGAFEVGALNYLIEEKKMDFQIFLGTSVGALNAAILAQSSNYEELKEYLHKLNNVWQSIKTKNDVFSGAFQLLRLILANSMYKPTGLQDLIKANVDPEKLFSSGRFLTIATVAGEDGELLYVNNREENYKSSIHQYILASASIPLLFPPVYIDGKHWFDGGLRDVTPLGNVFDEKPDEIVIIITYPLDSKLNPVYDYTKLRNTFSIIKRAINIITSEISANDIQLAHYINKNAGNFINKYKVPIRLISPPRSFDHGDSMKFEATEIKRMMEFGYNCAKSPAHL